MSVYYPISDIFFNIGRELVRGTKTINIFGYNSNVGTNFIPLWENNTAYTFPNQALNMTANSTSASDTNVTLKIEGLDENYDEIEDFVTLNGTTQVPIGTPFFRINNVITIEGNAVGNTTISSAGTIYAKIRAGEGKNQASIFTVPRGHNFLLNRIDAFSATAQPNKYVIFRNRTILPNGTNIRIAQSTFTGQMNIQRRVPQKYDEKQDIIFEGRSSDLTNQMSVFGEGVLIKTPIGD